MAETREGGIQVVEADNDWGTTDGGVVDGSAGTDKLPMESSGITGTGDQGDAATTSIEGGARVPED